MTGNRKLRVFLCHASQDKPVVRELYQRLLAEGWMDPWLDQEKLLPGQDWDLEIEKAVESADAVIVCLSSRSVSKEGYIQKELRFVLDIALEKPDGTIFVIPLRLDECEVPRRLRSWQYADYFPEIRDSAYGRLIASLRERQSALGNSATETVPEILDIPSQNNLDYAVSFVLAQENQRLHQLQTIATKRWYFPLREDGLDVKRSVRPWKAVMLALSLPLLMLFEAYMFIVVSDIRFFLAIFFTPIAFFILSGFMWRKLYDLQLRELIAVQKEKIKKLEG